MDTGSFELLERLYRARSGNLPWERLEVNERGTVQLETADRFRLEWNPEANTLTSNGNGGEESHGYVRAFKQCLVEVGIYLEADS